MTTPARSAKNSGGDLVERVVSALRGDIVTGKLRPGGKLPAEGKLATEFGVSRNVIREAMRELRATGLIAMSQGRAPQVKDSDPATAVQAMEAVLRDADNRLEHLTEVRTTLECGIAALACRRRSEADLAALRECIDALTRISNQNGQIEMDYEFHRRLVHSTANPVFIYIFEALSGLIRRSQETTYPHDGLVNALAGHQQILAAVEARDEDAAVSAMRTHLGHARDTLANVKKVQPLT